ncbi:3-keto-disaccharide hydrolase [Kiritimatiella glycovorans]|uniref:3-keto-alpha-glucoside-1,2-lyase/3-keto-2-hydroxy-glucal hydratase domain-containing protein n=1 Tax=Kiritimatiella glycovorans TaxID=1307763 RepID=A0A0G3EC17_9BACT|nr:DUF1080 domain-containing protein [Kiritimatiella glycovorans]AKJ63818.1 hypothetical protein L21SP4_00546 [Kiritimatiella glycovorans]
MKGSMLLQGLLLAALAAPASWSAPEQAEVLFDGTGFAKWNNPGGWKRVGEAMEVHVPEDKEKRKPLTTKDPFADCQFHVEWRPPQDPPDVRGQKRGNSGVFLPGGYEIQVLNSYENQTYPDGQAGAIYGQYAPQVNACLPQDRWQAYDILFDAPAFDADGAVARPARITALHNGIVIHHDAVLYGKIRVRKEGEKKIKFVEYRPHPREGRILLQNHNNPVRFRDIWVIGHEPDTNAAMTAIDLRRMRAAPERREYAINSPRQPAPPVVTPPKDGAPPSDARAAPGEGWRRLPAKNKGTAAFTTTGDYRRFQLHAEWEGGEPLRLEFADRIVEISADDDGVQRIDLVFESRELGDDRWETATLLKNGVFEQKRVRVDRNHETPVVAMFPAGDTMRRLWIRGLK